MKAWTKEEALNTLRELADEVDELKRSKIHSVEHTKWLTKCLDTLEEIFGNKSRYFLSFASLSWRPMSGTPIDIWQHGSHDAALDAVFHKAFLRDLEVAKGMLVGAIDYLSDRELSDVYIVDGAGVEAGNLLKVLNLAEHRLRKVVREKPANERQVQDALENLLIGADVAYGREVDSIEYSSKTYKPDFSLKQMNLAVEIKLCGREERERGLIAEINDDILAYKTKYQNLLFIIYDLGFIRDKDRFCSSFEEHENVTVRVIKH